jgi:hypothetical protein
MTKRREFVLRVIPLAGALAVLPRVTLAADAPPLAEEDKMAVSLGFRLSSAKVDQAKYPKHTTEQVCGKCLHYKSPEADTAKCDLFSKIVPKGGWCSGFSKRP